MDADQSLGRFADLFESGRGSDKDNRAPGLQDAIPRPHPDEAPKVSDAEWLALVRERGRALGREGGYRDAVPVALTTGLLGNLPDYPPAAYEAVKGMVSGAGAGRAYDESLAEQHGMREGLAETFPWLTFAGDTAGSLAPAGAAAKLVRAATPIGRVVQGTLIGGATGGAQGFANGEDWGGRTSGARDGAEIGAAFGGGPQALRELLRWVRRR